MTKEHRQDERFEDCGHVEANAICALPGVLDDISISGCKVHFPVPVHLDMDNDYNLKITLPETENRVPLRLLCRPQWKRMHDTATEIGFRFLMSPDTSNLKKYICSRRISENDSVYNMIINTQPVFVS